MKTVEIKGWIFAKVNEYNDRVYYEFSDNDYEEWAKKERSGSSTWAAYKKLVPHTITVEVPDFDVHAAKLASLEAERTALRAAFTLRLNEINDRISKLQALPFTPPEVVGA